MHKLGWVVGLSLVLSPTIALAGTITFSGANDSTAEATSSAGAYVSFDVTAQDASSSPLAVTCSPLAGTLFALGTTTVTCSASDASFSTSTTSFHVGVIDSTPPTITPPATQYFSTSTFPTTPTLTPATATDVVDPHPSITYSPTSFAAGTTTVTWTATDSSGNSAATTSLVVLTDTSASSTSTTTTASTTSATSTLNVVAHVDVPADCSATDTNGVVHQYAASSSTSYIGICALEAALASSTLSDAQFSNLYPSLGLFVTEFNGVSADPSSQYWALYQNGSFASVGIASLPIAAGDTIQFQLHDFSDNDLGDHVTFDVDSLVATSSASSATSIATTTSSSSTTSSGGGGGGGTAATFNQAAALSFLLSHENSDGSFGSSQEKAMLTDWGALALVAEGGATANVKAYETSATLPGASVTDEERHAIALEALGVNPYAAGGNDYITPIVNSFDGTQLGDASQDNDDIFGLLALTDAGYSPSDTMTQKVASFILSKQQADGSWDESPDMTAAALQVLPQFFVGSSISPAALGQALGEGEGYLESSQQADGGWGNVDSTSWVQTFINAVQLDDPTNAHSWANASGNTPLSSLQASQQADGGVRPVTDTTDNRIWSTSYALVAASGKDWDSLQQPFTKPSPSISIGGGGGLVTPLSSATSTATSSIALATTTAPIATSTKPVASTTAPMILPTIASSTPLIARTAPQRTFVHHITHLTTPMPEHIAASPSNTHEPPPTEHTPEQTASAASGGTVIGRVWHAVLSFFAHLF